MSLRPNQVWQRGKTSSKVEITFLSNPATSKTSLNEVIFSQWRVNEQD